MAATCPTTIKRSLCRPGSSLPNDLAVLRRAPLRGPVVQAADGLSYDQALPGNRSLTLGGEYFFNSDRLFGTAPSTRRCSTTVRFNRSTTACYYGALSAVFNDNETRSTYTLSNIGNFSDKSFITRLDFSILVISYLSVNAWADVHYGQTGGELKFALDVPANVFKNNPAISVAAPIVDLGVGLRVSL